ncbi:uncharacterized protein FOMMEDRAFT_158177 [Fomitiporia mediterranea MF3/22]|uniref:uncharacterized protein n=1 Tax=Fomitiporia mediterranea (strain MF3/22) TaxID=694068 RepID=UPI00044097B1|nr:uncharacterized protein FOMMEDRAFT_158177 [Fomitiporia mediterranea MF3/22]EJD01045.1 hypothetical protein FOMMEDRAFT_158177 [Fomitiporia mediterranea MF3/22]
MVQYSVVPQQSFKISSWEDTVVDTNRSGILMTAIMALYSELQFSATDGKNQERLDLKLIDLLKGEHTILLQPIRKAKSRVNTEVTEDKHSRASDVRQRIAQRLNITSHASPQYALLTRAYQVRRLEGFINFQRSLRKDRKPVKEGHEFRRHTHWHWCALHACKRGSSSVRPPVDRPNIPLWRFERNDGVFLVPEFWRSARMARATYRWMTTPLRDASRNLLLGSS